MTIFQDVLASYDYAFPQELIAKEPVSPRDTARLMIYDRKNEKISLDTFANLPKYLPKNSVIVFNKTKVIPAKLTLRRTTGGIVSALLISVQQDTITVFVSKGVRPGDKLIWKGGHSFSVIVGGLQESLLKTSFPMTQLKDLLEEYGETPLPPYLKYSPLSEDQRRREYQTVYADESGSIAAPTAGLHFTEELIKKCEHAGHDVRYVTLHVHLGTFAPLTEEQWMTKKLHTEYYSIDPQTVASLNVAKAEGRPIIAVGTTTVRTLESASDRESIVRASGTTDLFLTEESSLHFADHLMTNFHVPRSSLLMLVSAFTGREKLLEIYQKAIDERMRLFSFGDGMMII